MYPILLPFHFFVLSLQTPLPPFYHRTLDLYKITENMVVQCPGMEITTAVDDGVEVKTNYTRNGWGRCEITLKTSVKIRVTR
jgi:hypothetical protein